MKSLLALDPDLGRLLSHDRLAAAQRELQVRRQRLDVGPWDGARLVAAPGTLGLLIVDGVLAREVVLEDTVSTDLLGPGDVFRPWQHHSTPSLVAVETRWNVLATLWVAVLGNGLSAALTRFPEVSATIVERLGEAAVRSSVTQAIAHLNRVDRRLLALFWHLAERWGRVTTEGVVIPLALSHRLLGELVGARRPTVSSALSDLAREGTLLRRADATWVLTGEPATGDPSQAIELVRQRRRFIPADGQPRSVALGVFP